MDKKEIIKYLKKRIESCYRSLLESVDNKFMKKYIEGYRSRLDELILVYQHIKDISFVDACKELEVEYSDLDYNKYSINKEKAK